MQKIFPFLIALAMTLTIAACSTPGPGGKATINGTTAHHDDPIPFTKVYIKYGTLSSPGTDPSAYDDSTTADANAQFSFADLNKGEYYLYGVGFDSTIGFPVRAGIPVSIEKKNETVSVILPVTE